MTAIHARSTNRDHRPGQHTHGPTSAAVPANPPTTHQLSDHALMGLALDLAARGPLPDPNPRVGAVITDAQGRLIGQGYHRGAGTAHAETVALAQAGTAARGGTAYVTLEPCAHQGRTGACARALLESGVARVVYAQADPNPVAAGGHHRLAGAGVLVEGGHRRAEAVALNRVWSRAIELGRPYVTWKYAATLDGYSAAADGSSQWLTGPAARADVHDRRAECDAILVGTGTALADDPRLTVRHPDGTLRPRQPLRVVMGMRELPEQAHLHDTDAETLRLTLRDPHEALAQLHDRQIRHLWLEGGPRLAAAFLRAGFVDEVLAYLAPTLLGAGRPAVADLGVSALTERLDLEIHDVTMIGPDLRITARHRGGTPQERQ